MELKPCPFCGGEAKLVVCDDEGYIHDEPGYRDDPQSGLTFGIVHDTTCATDECPIATEICEGVIGQYIYNTEEEAISAWNTRMHDKESVMKNPEELTIEDLSRLICRVREMGADIQITIRPLYAVEEDAHGNDEMNKEEHNG